MTGTLDAIQILTFSISGIRMGVETSQIAEMLEPDEAAGRGLTVINFSDEVPFRGPEVKYAAPKVLTVRGRETSLGIVVDRPEEIASVGLEAVRPMPGLVEAADRTGTVWGVAVMDDDVILLVDFYKLRCFTGGSSDGLL